MLYKCFESSSHRGAILETGERAEGEMRGRWVGCEMSWFLCVYW